MRCVPVSAAEEKIPTDADTDTIAMSRVLEEVNVVAVKQDVRLRSEAVSATLVGADALERVGAESMKGISNIVPNFYIPDYGSRITSSIYVRGIGARMDQPAVGLNVDNVPYLNKNAYDFDLADIASVEMLRGPQSTLYGRNTMGGLINITTLSPMSWQGWRMMAEAGSGNSYRAAIGRYVKPTSQFGTSLNLNFSHLGGFFRNKYTGRLLDKENSGGARWKTVWRPSSRITLQNVMSASLLRQGGYPYEYIETGEINYNDTCFYRRFTLNDGITFAWRGDHVSMTSVTSVQHIDDNMTLDQDFLPESYFTLTQKQKETSVTEDIVVKSAGRKAYRWLGGLFLFHKDMGMQAPVTFEDAGIANLIEDHRNNANPYYPIAWDRREFVLNSDFKIPTFGVALYHESRYDLDRWHFSAGLRLDYERATLHYLSRCNTGYMIYERTGDGDYVPFRHVDIDIDDDGRLHRSYFNWMPRLSVLYNPGEGSGNIYVTVSKGYKAGGFNTQMFSEVLQQRLMGIMGIGGSDDVNKIVGYRPEYSWNYEVGSHLSFLEGKILSDLSLFYIDCQDQQLTTFPPGTTTGRMMTNAGKTRSYGGEMSLTAHPAENLMLLANYGHTDARFIKYEDGNNNYKGKYIPYAPQNTLFVQAAYEIKLPENKMKLNRISPEVNVRGTGKIYWNEANTQWQRFYAALSASVTFETSHWNIRIWGENLTDTRFHTFYFMSMGREFRQRGKPLRGGITFRINI